MNPTHGLFCVEQVDTHRLAGRFVLVAEETATLLGAIGMLLLAASWWRRAHDTVRIAQIGWVLVGFYFFTQAWTYLEHEDPILTVMAAGVASADTIRFWTTENQPERLAKQQAMADDFNKRTGHTVEVIPVEEKDLGTRATAAFAAGDLPGVI